MRGSGTIALASAHTSCLRQIFKERPGNPGRPEIIAPNCCHSNSAKSETRKVERAGGGIIEIHFFDTSPKRNFRMATPRLAPNARAVYAETPRAAIECGRISVDSSTAFNDNDDAPLRSSVSATLRRALPRARGRVLHRSTHDVRPVAALCRTESATLG